MDIMKKILHKIYTVLRIIRLYKTWPFAFLDKFKLLDGTMIHVLRNNARYLIRAKVDDMGKIDAIYIFKEYDEHLDRIKDDSIVIDIGAHIGVFSIRVALLAKNVRVYSYEPFYENFALLSANIALNDLEGSVMPFNLGITASGGQRELFIDRINPGASSIYVRTGRSSLIDTITLKDVFDKNRLSHCDFLKLDCEGAEYEILFNTPVDYLGRIEAIAMEYHPNGDIRRLMDFLTENNFVVKLREEDHLLYAAKKT